VIHSGCPKINGHPTFLSAGRWWSSRWGYTLWTAILPVMRFMKRLPRQYLYSSGGNRSQVDAFAAGGFSYWTIGVTCTTVYGLLVCDKHASKLICDSWPESNHVPSPFLYTILGMFVGQTIRPDHCQVLRFNVFVAQQHFSVLIMEARCIQIHEVATNK